jgi:DNA repair protein radc
VAIEQHQLGHRARLRERFLTAGRAAITDYELLELILYGAYPRGDIKPLAKTLIKEFKCFAGVIYASPTELRRIKGIGPAALASIRAVQVAAEVLLHEPLKAGPVHTSLSHVLEYLKVTMQNLKYEQLRILFLDKRNQLIADEVQQTGTIDHTPVYPREVVKRALELGASGLILVHNHPTGDPTPSQADVRVTQDIQDAAIKLGVLVHDHIIIGKGTHVSFRTQGLL